MLECLLMGSPPPGVPPGDDAQEGAILIFGVMRVLSDSLRFGKAFITFRKLLSGDEGEAPNHHPPNIPPEIYVWCQSFISYPTSQNRDHEWMDIPILRVRFEE